MQCGGSSSRALGGYKSASWSVLLTVGTVSVVLWVYFTGGAVPFSIVLKDVMNDGQTESLAASIRSFGCAKYV